MAVDPAVLRIVTSYGDRAALIRQQVLGFIQRAWGSLDAWRDADIERFVSAVAPVVTGGQFQIAALTDGYLAAVEAAMTGLPVRPVGVASSLVTDEAVRGVAAADVYRRTGPTVWTALSNGDPLPVAAGKGLRRALSMGSTDLQLAKTHTSRHVFSGKDRVRGYRRTLNGSHSCGLCIVASTQRYRKESLMPIHGNCSCGVIPIIGTTDPGQVIDPGRLADVHQVINERFGAFDEGARGGKDGIPDYRKVLISHDHGEIGPVLSVRGQKFTGPDDLP